MTIRLRSVLVAASLVALVTSCVNENDTDELIDSSYQGLTSLSPDQRYIVTFANPSGRTTLAATRARTAIDLPEQNAAAVYLSDADVAALRKNPSIEAVEVDYPRYPLAETVPYGVTMVQAAQVSHTNGIVKLCIIDSGLLASHPDFAGIPVTGETSSGFGQWNQDGCGHGTHVAGTITAATGNGTGVSSVASGTVDLHIVRVFDNACSWTFSSNLIQALNACQAAGARVVSMSLGGSFKSRTEDNAFKSADSAGVLSIAAAGNGGNTQLSYPAGYGSVVSVAAIDSAKTVATFSQQNSDVELAAPGVAVLSTYNTKNTVAIGSDERIGNQIEFAPFVTRSGALVDGGRCTAAGSFAGKVVLCERGDISFVDKVNNVVAGGGVAAVIYNNAPGNFAGTLGAGNSSSIPAISISQADGQDLVANKLGQNGTVESATGVAGYAELDGTSMATPHTSAVAALVWSNFPTRTNSEIRNALTATAEDLGAAGRDNAFGFGLVRAKAAFDLLNGGGGPPPTCAPVGDPCSTGADCCSGLCSGGKPSSRVCLAP